MIIVRPLQALKTRTNSLERASRCLLACIRFALSDVS